MSDPTIGLNLAFEASFTAPPSLQTAVQHGTFKTVFDDGTRWLVHDGQFAERQIYIEPTYGALGLNPFPVADGNLLLTAQPSGANQPKLQNKPFWSGLLTTETTHQQQYGYFEIRARMPKPGPGLWSAFWLLAGHKQWPPEIDILEVSGKRAAELHTNFLTRTATGSVKGNGLPINTGVDLSADFHTYGLRWTADDLTWYFDGTEVRRAPTPDDMHTPMYLLVNLAIGDPKDDPGGWIGLPDATTPFPACLAVDYLRCWTEEPVDADQPAVTFSNEASPTQLWKSLTVFPRRGSTRILKALDFDIWGLDPAARVTVTRTTEGRLYVIADGPWNALKNVRVRNERGRVDCHLHNFVHATVDAPAGSGSRCVIEHYKRGAVRLGPGAIARLWARGFDAGDNTTRVELIGQARRLETIGNAVTVYDVALDGADTIDNQGGRLLLRPRA